MLAQHGFDADVHDAHISGWGLLDVIDGASALDVLGRELLAHPDVDTVVFEWAGACSIACGPALPYGSPRFYDAWDAAARAVVTSARARGLQVLWAVSPPTAPPPNADPPVEDWFSFPMRYQVGNALVAHDRAYGPMFGIATADWTDALSDTSGGWQSQLSYDGGVHVVRLDDNVHLSEDGSVRAVIMDGGGTGGALEPTPGRVGGLSPQVANG